MNKRRVAVIGLSVLLLTYHIPFPTGKVCNVQSAASDDETADVEIADDGDMKAYEKYAKEYPNCVHGMKEWKKVDGKYQYPVTAYDEEWLNYPSVEEKYAACKIPDEILDSLTTKELLELVIDCPVFINISAYDSYEQGIKEVAEQFNGLDELLKRSDCKDVLLDYYSAYKIPKKQQLEWKKSYKEDIYKVVNNEKLMKKAEADTKVKLIVVFCETILADDDLAQKASEEELLEMIQVVSEKEEAKEISEIFEDYSVKDNVFLTTLLEENTSITKKCTTRIKKKFGITRLKKASKIVLKTPSGTVVPYTVNSSARKITDHEAATWLNDFKGNINISPVYGKSVVSIMIVRFEMINVINPVELFIKLRRLVQMENMQ